MSSTLEKKLTTAEGIVIEKIDVPDYEKVLKITHGPSKLQAIVAIHNTALGPALGGTRIYPYKNFDLALEDVLRLAKGMTYKSAAAQVGFGGGKSVIIADPKTDKKPELLKAFGLAIKALEGEYICAEDSGCTLDDVKIIHSVTKYVVGLPHDKSSGDPGRYTAWGIFRGMQATMQYFNGSDSLEGTKVLIQGLGNVGMFLLEYLFWAGADIYVSDIDQKKIAYAQKKYQTTVVGFEDVFSFPCDIFSPCALGGILNEETIPQLQCKAVVGAANNQLLQEKNGEELKKRNILYAPDFVLNAGGLLNVSSELEREGYNSKNVRKKTSNIYDSISAIYSIAKKNGISTNQAAVSLAKYRIQYRIGMRLEKLYFHHSI